jgi:hypothetical protein
MNGTPSTNPGRPHERALNVVLRRDDQIGCALFGPIDLVERERTGVRDAV